MLSSNLPNLPTPLDVKPVFCAAPDGVLLFSWLAEAAQLPPLLGPLATLPPDITIGAKVDIHEQRVLILIWCAPNQIGLVAQALGPRDLSIWPGHLHAQGRYVPIQGVPHLSLSGLTPPTPPPWLLQLWQGVPA